MSPICTQTSWYLLHYLLHARELTLEQEFVKNHCEVFKLLAALIQDVKLLAQLSKIVSELLSSIRGNLKAKVSFSLVHASHHDTDRYL
jgi:hypothetical protein